VQSATTGPPGPVSPRALIERATHKSLPRLSEPLDNLEGALMPRAWPTHRQAPAPITPMEPRARTSLSLLTPNTCPPVPHRRRRGGEGRARGQESEGLRSAGPSPGIQSRRCLAQLPVHEAGDKHGRERARKESECGQAGQGEPSTLATLDGIRSAKELILSLMQVSERFPVGTSACLCFWACVSMCVCICLLASAVLCACACACRPLDFLSVTCLLVDPPVPVRTARHVADVGGRYDCNAEPVEIPHAEVPGRKQSAFASMPHTGHTATMVMPTLAAACAEKKEDLESNETAAHGSTLCATPKLSHGRQHVAASVAQDLAARGNTPVAESEMYTTPILALTSAPHQGHAFEDDFPPNSSAPPGSFSSPCTPCTCACSASLLHDMIQVHVSMYMHAHAGERLCAYRRRWKCLDWGK